MRKSKATSNVSRKAVKSTVRPSKAVKGTKAVKRQPKAPRKATNLPEAEKVLAEFQAKDKAKDVQAKAPKAKAIGNGKRGDKEPRKKAKTAKAVKVKAPVKKREFNPPANAIWWVPVGFCIPVKAGKEASKKVSCDMAFISVSSKIRKALESATLKSLGIDGIDIEPAAVFLADKNGEPVIL